MGRRDQQRHDDERSTAPAAAEDADAEPAAPGHAGADEAGEEDETSSEGGIATAPGSANPRQRRGRVDDARMAPGGLGGPSGFVGSNPSDDRD